MASYSHVSYAFAGATFGGANIWMAPYYAAKIVALSECFTATDCATDLCEDATCTSNRCGTTPKASGTECRLAADLCDVAEVPQARAPPQSLLVVHDVNTYL